MLSCQLKGPATRSGAAQPRSLLSASRVAFLTPRTGEKCCNNALQEQAWRLSAQCVVCAVGRYGSQNADMEIRDHRSRSLREPAPTHAALPHRSSRALVGAQANKTNALAEAHSFHLANCTQHERVRGVADSRLSRTAHYTPTAGHTWTREPCLALWAKTALALSLGRAQHAERAPTPCPDRCGSRSTAAPPTPSSPAGRSTPRSLAPRGE
eukprot:4437176-Prymnesium_polylepis.1